MDMGKCRKDQREERSNARSKTIANKARRALAVLVCDARRAARARAQRQRHARPSARSPFRSAIESTLRGPSFPRAASGHALCFVGNRTAGGVHMAGRERSLYMLPFDHRGSFETGLFGWKGALSAEQ